MGDFFTITYRTEELDYASIDQTIEIEAKDIIDAVKKAEKQLGKINKIVGVMRES